MSSLMDGLSNIYSLTAQINNLKSSGSGEVQSTDSLELSLEQNFNQMLTDLVSTDDNEEDKNKNYDPFAFLTTSSQQYMSLLTGQNTTTSSSSTTSSSETELNNVLNLFQQAGQSNNSYLYSLLYSNNNLQI